jgi:hypothetical protein
MEAVIWLDNWKVTRRWPVSHTCQTPMIWKLSLGYDFNQTVVEAKIYFFPLRQIQFIFYLNWPKGMWDFAITWCLPSVNFLHFLFLNNLNLFFLMVKYRKFYFLKWTMSTILSNFLNWNFFPKLEKMWVKIHLKQPKTPKSGTFVFTKYFGGNVCASNFCLG